MLAPQTAQAVWADLLVQNLQPWLVQAAVEIQELARKHHTFNTLQASRNFTVPPGHQTKSDELLVCFSSKGRATDAARTTQTGQS